MKKIAFLGDSLTYEGRWERRYKVQTQCMVANFGVSGDTTKLILERLDPVVSFRPHLLFMMAGINDFRQHVEAKVALDNYRCILQTLKRRLPEMRGVIQSTLPVNAHLSEKESDKTTAIQIPFFNETLRSFAKDLEYDYLDLYSDFLDSDGLLKAEFTYDGVHLKASAYEFWRDLLVERIPLDDL